MRSIKDLRDSLIKEAKNSPMLLSDLAGLEAYVSESYNSRSFIELLQNADDAGSTKFYVKHYRIINIILALTLLECIWSMLCT